MGLGAIVNLIYWSRLKKQYTKEHLLRKHLSPKANTRLMNVDLYKLSSIPAIMRESVGYHNITSYFLRNEAGMNLYIWNEIGLINIFCENAQRVFCTRISSYKLFIHLITALLGTSFKFIEKVISWTIPIIIQNIYLQ